ncbi:terminase small subunit [Paracidovorax citrulli]|uniref:terminase small subunit n=1 Tax=Paracidovorax citrulli TaxID=80869 RepID=UPI001F42BA24|nr:terminase small subunit [Paracidovorax citrulli]
MTKPTSKKPMPAKGKSARRSAKAGAAPKKAQITTEDRHRLFAREFVANGFNATQAAVSAGYSTNTAASQGARLLRDAKVQEYVREAKAVVIERAEVKGEDVVRRLNQMLMADPRELLEAFVASEHVKVVVASIKQPEAAYSMRSPRHWRCRRAQG